MTNRSRWIAVYRSRTATEFIEALSPIRGVLASVGEPDEFVFRGHSSDTYQLLPTVFRGRGVSFPDRRPVHRRTFYNQLWAELVWLKEFFDLADARGLPLPEDSQELRDTLEECSSPPFLDSVAAGKAYWPPAKLLSLLALAQHYGVSTRLLDWTRNAYVAAYFAAVDARPKARGTRLAVWAFMHDLLARDSEFEWVRDRFQMVTAPAAGIPNLQAQRGVFVVWRESKFRPSATFKALPQDRVLIDNLHDLIKPPLFFKFTLPVGQASNLLSLLALTGVDGSTCFPGFGGVVRALKERGRQPPPGNTAQLRRERGSRRRYAEFWRSVRYRATSAG